MKVKTFVEYYKTITTCFSNCKYVIIIINHFLHAMCFQVCLLGSQALIGFDYVYAIFTDVLIFIKRFTVSLHQEFIYLSKL